MNIPDSLKDLTFAVNFDEADLAQVDFSTASLTKLDPKCAPDAAVSSIGFVGRGRGTYDPKYQVFKSDIFIKQFDGFWLHYSHNDSSACSSNPQTEVLHKQQATAFRSLITKPADVQPL